MSHERFTENARKVIQLANIEAQRLNHEYIGTEHILLGILKHGECEAYRILQALNMNLTRIQLEVEKFVQSGPEKVMIGKLPQTPRAKKVIELAIEQALALNDTEVGTEHLLIGLIAEKEGVANSVLTNLGLTIDQIKSELEKAKGNGDAGNPSDTLSSKAILSSTALPDDMVKYIIGLVVTRVILELGITSKNLREIADQLCSDFTKLRKLLAAVQFATGGEKIPFESTIEGELGDLILKVSPGLTNLAPLEKLEQFLKQFCVQELDTQDDTAKEIIERIFNLK